MNFIYKFCVKDMKALFFANTITDFVHLRYDITPWSKTLRSTIPIQLGDLKVMVTDLEKNYVTVLRKNFKTSSVTDLTTQWVHVWYTKMKHTDPKSCTVPSQPRRPSQGQGIGTFKCKFCVKFL